MLNLSVQVIGRVNEAMSTPQPFLSVGKGKELMLKVANFGKKYKWQILAAVFTASVIAGVVVCLTNHKNNK